jgi:uncharacterized protein (TIGR00730 family)
VTLGRLCIYAGSSPGADPAYARATEELAEVLAGEGIGVVYGGGNIGLMGVLADSVLRHGGEVIGVIPQQLMSREIAHADLTDLRVVGSMHERKALMADLADGFVALPGGIGTLEELIEAFTWTQLGLHAKPVSVLNVRAYYTGLLGLLDVAVEQRFLRPEHRAMLLADDDPQRLLAALRAWELPAGFDGIGRVER